MTLGQQPRALGGTHRRRASGRRRSYDELRDRSYGTRGDKAMDAGAQTRGQFKGMGRPNSGRRWIGAEDPWVETIRRTAWPTASAFVEWYCSSRLRHYEQHGHRSILGLPSMLHYYPQAAGCRVGRPGRSPRKRSASARTVRCGTDVHRRTNGMARRVVSSRACANWPNA